MELCEDLIERIELYGISQYFDSEAMMKKLHENWRVKQSEDQTFEHKVTTVKGYFTGMVSSLFKTMSDHLFKFGFVGVAQSSLTKWAFGCARIHPGYFMVCLVTSAFINMGASSIHKQSLKDQIEVMTTHFSVVTSNLMNEYIVCSESVCNSFKTRDTMKVQSQLQNLING